MDSRPPNLLLLLLTSLLHFCKDPSRINSVLLVNVPIINSLLSSFLSALLQTQGNVPECSHVGITPLHCVIDSCLIIVLLSCSFYSNEALSGYPVLAVLECKAIFYLTPLFFAEDECSNMHSWPPWCFLVFTVCLFFSRLR